MLKCIGDLAWDTFNLEPSLLHFAPWVCLKTFHELQGGLVDPCLCIDDLSLLNLKETYGWGMAFPKWRDAKLCGSLLSQQQCNSLLQSILLLRPDSIHLHLLDLLLWLSFNRLFWNNLDPLDHRELTQQGQGKYLSPFPRLHPDFDNSLSLFSFLPKRMP